MKSRAFPYAVVALVVCGGGVAWMQCSGSVCGNMKVESGEQCDKGAMNGVDGSGCSSDVPVREHRGGVDPGELLEAAQRGARVRRRGVQ